MAYITTSETKFGRTERKFDMARFANDLCRAMGGTALEVQYDHSATFTLGNDRISIYADYRAKVTVGIHAPDVDYKDIRYGNEFKTVSAGINPDGRTIDKIAADVRKRVVLANQPVLAAQRARRDELNGVRTKMVGTKDRLAEMGLQVRVGDDGLSGSIYNQGRHHLVGSFHTDTVSISSIGSMSIEKFQRILAIINEA